MYDKKSRRDDMSVENMFPSYDKSRRDDMSVQEENRYRPTNPVKPYFA